MQSSACGPEQCPAAVNGPSLISKFRPSNAGLNRARFSFVILGIAAAGGTLLAFFVQRLLLPNPSVAPFVFFYFGVVIAAYFGGAGAGLLATVMSALLANYYFMVPVASFTRTAAEITATILFVISSAVGALICAYFRGAYLELQRQSSARQSAEQRLRDHERELAAIYDNAPIVLMLIDENRRIVKANGMAHHLNATGALVHGRRVGEALGCAVALTDPAQCGTGPDCDRCLMRRTLLDTLENGHRQVRIEFSPPVEHASDDAPPTFLLSSARLSLNGRPHVLLALQDISSLKRQDEQLRRLNDSLEEQVAKRTAEARHRADQLQALASELTMVEERERRRLAQLLHDDLQQSLVAAHLRLGALARPRYLQFGAHGPRTTVAENADSSFAANQAGVDTADAVLARQELEAVSDLIKQAIESARSLTTELSPSILFDAGLTAALEWLVRRKQEKYGLSITLEIDQNAEPVDQDLQILVFRAVREFLFNIVKHAGVGKAHVKLRRAADGSSEVIVEDEGKGFDSDDLKNRRTTDGGFGLFSIEERIGRMGGSLGVVSRPGHGTKVVLRTPPHSCSERAPVIARVPSTESSHLSRVTGGRIRVLIIDDHQVTREGVARLLERTQDIMVVGQANDGSEALAAALAVDPDVITMDVSMPKMNGMEATKQVLARLPMIRVIGLSMHQDPEVQRSMREAGAVALINKAGDPEELVAAIRSCVGTRTSNRPTDASHQDAH